MGPIRRLAPLFGFACLLPALFGRPPARGPADGEATRALPDVEWRRHGGTHAEQRYSALDQITAAEAKLDQFSFLHAGIFPHAGR